MGLKPSHCRACKQSFIHVEQSAVPHLCLGCKMLLDGNRLYSPLYYYCESCKEFCLASDGDHPVAKYCVDSMPYCYGCDPDWDEYDEGW